MKLEKLLNSWCPRAEGGGQGGGDQGSVDASKPSLPYPSLPGGEREKKKLSWLSFSLLSPWERRAGEVRAGGAGTVESKGPLESDSPPDRVKMTAMRLSRSSTKSCGAG